VNEKRLATLLPKLDDPNTIDTALEVLAERERRRSTEDRKKSDSMTAGAFRPTPKMLRYVLMTRQFAASKHPYSQRAVAELSDVHEDVVSRWHRVPGFDEWFSEQVLGEVDRLIPLADLSLVWRAIRTGDPRDVEMAHRVRGWWPTAAPAYVDPQDTAGASPATVPYTLNLLVPRPEMPPVVPRSSARVEKK
jgi:hypothetical protein